MSTVCRLRTEAWYGDREIEIVFPDRWHVSVHTPKTPAPLSDVEIDEALRYPVGQDSISCLARGRSRPLIIVDDLTRPTPAARVVPAVLRQLEEAGIAASDVTILLATGTHRETSPEALAKKVGPGAATSCRLLVHDDARELTKVGRTSFGTPVLRQPRRSRQRLRAGYRRRLPAALNRLRRRLEARARGPRAPLHRPPALRASEHGGVL